MKSWMICLVLAAVLLLGSVSVGAGDFGATACADYLFGKLESWWRSDSDVNGFLLRAEAPVTGPFGVLGEAGFLTAKDYFYGESESLAAGDLKVQDWNLFATYALPIEGVQLKALGGYGSARFPDEADVAYAFKGFKLGAAAELKPVENLTLNGLVAFGLGAKACFNEGDEFDAKATEYRLSGSYAVTSNVAIEAGYSYAKYEYTDEAPYFATKGFFVGAKATF
ncbi:MAG: hypothetical protein ACM3RP_12575 [Chitinophagales bacterium]